MEIKNNEMIISDISIISFYRENPNLDFLKMNYLLIEILKNLSVNLSETLNNTLNSKIFDNLNDFIKDFSSFKNDINQNSNNQINLLLDKLIQTKREYIEDIKLILSNNSLNNIEKINLIIEKNNDNLLTKTNLLINNIIPKSQEILYNQISNELVKVTNLINERTSKFIDVNKDENTLKEFISNIDNQYNKMILNLQQPIFNYIQSSEERTTKNIKQINDTINKQELQQETLNNEMRCFLSRYTNNSSLKGKISEAELYSILQIIFPSDEIINCAQNTATCDYRINRYNSSKPSILFENKDYTYNVPTSELEKFQRDIKLQGVHGILLSQNSNITYKDNFQIDIIDGLIHVYIPNVNYNPDKIKIAVDIIDNLSPTLSSLIKENEETAINISFDKEDIDNLLLEYNNFNDQKNEIIECLKINNKNIIDKLEIMQLNSIKKILLKHHLLIDNELKCNNNCGFIGKNKASLSAHKKKCNKKILTPIENIIM